LLEVAGIDFKSFLDKGIDGDFFGEVFTTSGLVLNNNIKWVTFHGSYDFAYLLKVLTNQVLPEDELPFNELLNIYFPCYYDVRYMIRNATWLKGSLSRISHDLDIRRIGHTHQAGSDSLVTSKVFFKIVQNYNEHIDINLDKNKLFGFVYKMYDEYDYNMGYNYNAIPNYMSMPGSVNKNGKNMMYYQNVNNGYNNYNPNVGINPMIYNNYSSMNNFNPIYPPNYDYNFYNNYYPKSGNNKPASGSNDKYQSPS
jgi:CCR4-NOT transcription complex subunit 7/8